jgi:hypothetical protein
MCRLLILLAAASLAVSAADPLYESAERKLDLIESGQASPGSVITFSPPEMNAWALVRMPEIVPEGIRRQRVELGNGTANGYALADFQKMRQGTGVDTNWLIARLIEGERPLKVAVRVASGGGRCTVYVTQVEISNRVISAAVLDFVIKTFFLPLYPEAKINEPFELGYNIDRVDIRPAGLSVTIRK